MQSHKRATPQPSPTHQPHTHTHTKWRQARRQGWHKASVPQQSEAPTTMVFCHHTHTASATIKPASPKGTWCWCLWQGSCHSLTHTPQGRGEPWLMTRGVHHGSSHSHTQVANTPATVQHALVHAMVSINHATHTHTPKEEDHGLMAKVASTTCHHYERERDWMVDSGLVSVDKPLATQQGKRRHHSSHAAITQASTNNHHTITLTTQAWSWSLTACSLTHTHEGQGRTRSTPPPSQWCGWLAQ